MRVRLSLCLLLFVATQMGCERKITLTGALQNSFEHLAMYCDFVLQKIENPPKDEKIHCDFISNYLFISLEWLKHLSSNYYTLWKSIDKPELKEIQERIDKQRKLSEENKNKFFLTHKEIKEKEFIETLGKDVRQNMETIKEALFGLKTYAKDIDELVHQGIGKYGLLPVFVYYLKEILKTLEAWEGKFWQKKESKSLEEKIKKDIKILESKSKEVLHSFGVKKVVNIFNGTVVVFVKEKEK